MIMIKNGVRPGYLIALVILNLVMVFGAMTIDYKDFVETPFYLWIFVPICPLYPFLLAVNYIWYLLRRAWPQFLLNFAAVGIISYSAMAFIFYPLYMYENGFGWYEFGNIFWVLLYGSQIFLIWPHLRRISASSYVFIALYFFAKDFLDRFSVTYSYQRYGLLGDWLQNTLFIAILILHIAAIFIVVKKTSKRS